MTCLVHACPGSIRGTKELSVNVSCSFDHENNIGSLLDDINGMKFILPKFWLDSSSSSGVRTAVHFIMQYMNGFSCKGTVYMNYKNNTDEIGIDT